MKKISLLAILIFITGIMFSCSDSSSSDTEEGYIDPGLTAKTVSSVKEYTFTGSIGDSCSGSQCDTVIFSGELNDIDYVGIAADNRHTVNPPTFKFKMYWQANSVPTGVGLTLNSCTIIINDDTVSATDVIGVSIINNSDGTYTITFPNITVGTESITSGNHMRAYKY